MQDVLVTADDLALLRTLRRYLALGDPLGSRATVPNIVRYMGLGDAADVAARRGASRQAWGYRLQRVGLERQHIASWLLTAGLVLPLLMMALVEGVRAWQDFGRIVPGVQAVVSAATTPDFSKFDGSYLAPDPLRGRLTPDPERAFAPVVEDYRQRSWRGVEEVRSAVSGVGTHLLAGATLALAALLVGILQPQEVARRWILPVAGRLLLSVAP